MQYDAFSCNMLHKNRTLLYFHATELHSVTLLLENQKLNCMQLLLHEKSDIHNSTLASCMVDLTNKYTYIYIKNTIE